jgi:hypothetical protein
MFMGNLSGLFFMLGGGLGCCACCGGVIGRVLSCVLGVRSLLSDVYFVLSVRVYRCLLHGLGQFWLQLGWQNSCSAMCSAFFLVLLGFYSKFGSLLVTLGVFR